MAPAEDDGFELIQKSEVLGGPDGSEESQEVKEARQAPEGEAGGEPVRHEVESLLAITLAYLSGCCQAVSAYALLAGKRVCAAYQRAIDSQAVAIAATHTRRLARATLAASKQQAAVLGGVCEQALARAAVRAQEARLPQLLQPSSSAAAKQPEAGVGSTTTPQLLRAVVALLARELLLLAFLAQELCLCSMRCLPRRAGPHAQAA